MRRKLNKKRKKYDMIILTDGSSILYDYNLDLFNNAQELVKSIKIIEARKNLENIPEKELIKIVHNYLITMKIVLNGIFSTSDKIIDNYSKSDKIESTIKEETYSNLDNDTSMQLKTNSPKKRIRKK